MSSCRPRECQASAAPLFSRPLSTSAATSCKNALRSGERSRHFAIGDKDLRRSIFALSSASPFNIALVSSVGSQFGCQNSGGPKVTLGHGNCGRLCHMTWRCKKGKRFYDVRPHACASTIHNSPCFANVYVRLPVRTMDRPLIVIAILPNTTAYASDPSMPQEPMT